LAFGELANQEIGVPRMLDLRIPGANPQDERSERENLLSGDIPQL